MLRKCVPFLMLFLMFFTGCGKGKDPMQQALDFRTGLMGAEKCSFTAKIRADYGEKLYDFTLEAVCGQEETRLTVREPEEIAGISAVVTGDGAKLEFDGVELDFGKLANGYVSPLSVPWLLAQCWKGEYISMAGSDGELYRVTYLRGYEDAELTVDTWFTADGLPIHGEVLYDDVRCITVEIEDFQM